ncbi:hypothetical protein [Pseudoramibacter alactolyticus]|uniref:hypothetical protein n=1 Tax=Pseudoramibacter alactolyticus TaxID=113287 RepID=UPI002356521D|nr:hypothetical protein [Pseudoramibacter alactolyticus]MBM6969124.1 hypothetical protein [Pseudoramibacter alactolyticus]
MAEYPDHHADAMNRIPAESLVKPLASRLLFVKKTAKRPLRSVPREQAESAVRLVKSGLIRLA